MFYANNDKLVRIMTTFVNSSVFNCKIALFYIIKTKTNLRLMHITRIKQPIRWVLGQTSSH